MKHVLPKFPMIVTAISNVFEWYDFIVYSSLAPLLAKAFFPTQDKFIGLLLTFTVFVLGFITRPFGGLLLGRLADQYGRRKTLLISLSAVAVPALLIGFMPTYAEIGRIAPLLLLLLRLIQCFAIGGEYPITVSYLSELAPIGRKGFWSSFANVTTVLGVLLSTVIVAVLNHSLSTSALQGWGWRIPFLLSALFLFFILIIRLRLYETTTLTLSNKVFSDFTSKLNKNRKILLKIFLVVICAAVAYYSYNVFTMTYLVSHAGFSYSQSLTVSVISSLFLIIFIPLGGYLSDIFSSRRIIGCALFLISLSFPLYHLFTLHSISYVLIAQFVFAFLLSVYFGALPSFMCEQANNSTRCLNIGAAYNVSLTIFGGTVPLIDMYLTHHLNSSLAPGLYLSMTAMVSLAALYLIKDANFFHLSTNVI